MTILLSTPLLTALLVLLVVVLWGPERIYRRMLELIREFRGGGSSQALRRRHAAELPRPEVSRRRGR